jgi:putative DNA primase/helicase
MTALAKRSTLTADVIGKWPAILEALGIDKRHLSGKHGPCPLCDGGKDRFRFDDRNGRGTWICSLCGSGDGFALIMKIKGWDFRAAAREIEPLVGSAKAISVRQGPDEATVRREMNAIWAGAKALSLIDATQRWWMRRLGSVPVCPDLRAHPSLRADGAHFQGQVALVRGADGKAVNLHRTFLGPDGEKAPIESPRRVMPIAMPKGCAVRLMEPTGTLGIAEGIETALAAAKLFGIPCWAVLNAGNMENWIPPADVAVTIFGDNDESLVGHKSAYTVASRLKRLGVKTEVRMADIPGCDWNDVLMRSL